MLRVEVYNAETRVRTKVDAMRYPVSRHAHPLETIQSGWRPQVCCGRVV